MLWELGGEKAPARDETAAVYLQVALDLPPRKSFSYLALPADRQASGVPQLGCRVRVPFGPRSLIGFVVGVERRAPQGVPAAKVKPVQAVLDAEPLLTPALLRLARWMADATFCSWGSALAAMLPAALRRDQPRRTVPVVELGREIDAAERAELAKRYPKQEQALAWLQQAGGPVPVRDFLSRTGLSRSPLDSLAKRGLAQFGRTRAFTDPFGGAPPPQEIVPEPTPAQQACIDRVIAVLDRRESGGFLLHGITGSGKTEVYLRALHRCLEQGRSAIILVPEISLTPQAVARFRARFGDLVAVLHSALTDAERHDQWVAIRDGRLRVVVGARSALFAPCQELGLIVVDEEHESSFKQESVPRYHARDVALERAHLEHAVCVLGSATPALESWQAAQAGHVELLELKERVAGGSLPTVELVDMRLQKPERGHWNVISQPLARELERILSRKERAILFLNQRGFAPAWHCKTCGGSVHCKRCDVALTYHRWRKKALCHYCLQESAPPTTCAACGRPTELVGVGTERAEDALRNLFPDVRAARMDRDTMMRRESYEEVLNDFGAGRYDVLLGTQMVAKGLDFPEVTLVGVLNADTALHHPDFRAAERCFGLIAQVSGRAGRSALGGRVIVQTWLPEHPAVRAAVHHDYPGFAARELEERRAFGYPPCGAALRLTFEAADAVKAEALARDAAEKLRAAFPARRPGVQMLGPAIPPVERLKNRVRRQLLIKAPSKRELQPLHAVLYELCQRPGVTVDPL
ncbi:MAG TPA: primosomal protein N' [Planctomycetota bacterium]